MGRLRKHELAALPNGTVVYLATYIQYITEVLMSSLSVRKTLWIFVAAVVIPAVVRADDPVTRAAHLLNERKFGEAKSLLISFVEKNSTHAAAAYYLGRLWLEEGNYEQAIDWFEKAVELDKTSSEYHVWLGRAYGRAAREASIFRKPSLARKTKAAFEQAVHLDPANVDARLALMEFYRQAPGIAGGSIQKAIEQAELVKRLDPYRGQLALGQIHEGEKQYSEAKRAYSEALRQFPDSSAAYFRLASLYTLVAQYDSAFEILNRILKRQPGSLLVHYHIGKVGAVSGQRLEQAEQSLKIFLRNQPPMENSWQAAAHWRLGMVYEKQGKLEDAGAEYQQALKLKPDHEEAKSALTKLRKRSG